MTTYVNDIAVTTKIVVETCCNCYLTFGVSAEFQKARVADKRTFYCPNGHAQHYLGTSLEERLRRAEAREVALRDQKEATERSLIATKGHVTRAKKRAAAGVCQWCNRHFEQVAKHVATKHPEHAHGTTP